MRRIAASFIIAFFFFSYSGTTQTGDETPAERKSAPERSRFEVETDLIEVRTIVTDPKGQIVEGLNKEDFILLENGQEKEIDHFNVSKIEGGSKTSGAGDEPLPDREVRLQKAQMSLNRPPVRTILLYVDALHLSFASVDWVKQALRRFIDEQLTDQDLVAFTSSQSLGVAQQFTRDPRVLRHAVEQVRYNPVRDEGDFTANLAADVIHERPDAIQMAIDLVRREGAIQCPCTRLRNIAYSRALQILADASYARQQTLSIIEQYVEQMKELPGNRMIVVFSDGLTSYNGVGSFERSDFQNVVSRAARSGVVIYSIDAKGLQGPATISVESRGTSYDMNYLLLMDCLNRCVEEADGSPDCGLACVREFPSSLVCGEDLANMDPLCGPPDPVQIAGYLADSEMEMMDGLHMIAAETGGRLMEKTNDLNGALAEALDDNRLFYVLSYYLSEGSNRNRFRNIEVQVRNHPEYKVRTPRGFWPGRLEADTGAAAPKSPQELLLDKMGSPMPVTDLGVSACADYIETEDDDKQVSLTVYFEGDRLNYGDQEDKGGVELEILSFIYDSSGNRVDGISARVEALLTRKGIAQAQSSGYRFSRRLALTPGAYQFRTGVREEGTDRMGTATTWIEVPESNPNRLGMSSLILSDPIDLQGVEGEGVDVNRLQQVKMIQGIPMYSRDDIFYYSFRVRPRVADAPVSGRMIMREVLQGGETVRREDWTQEPSNPEGADAKGWIDCDGELDISSLEPGVYELRISIKDSASKDPVSRSVAFGIL